ncbi:hypothetical protein RAH41_02235 [Gottfriedia acidiceleris]|uniref:hypothetical protein n=1 Tax=Gottfriedia acidiceleris TaxID=371036 RepID=UPI002F26180F
MKKSIPIYFSSHLTGNWVKKVIPSIDLGLKEMKELHVKSTTIYDAKQAIIVNISLNSSDKKAKEIARQIETLINEFFQNKQIKKAFSGPHNVIVQSSDNKKIN